MSIPEQQSPALSDVTATPTPRLSRILVVDDEEQTLLSLSVTLGQAGYAVDEAGNGAEALDILAQASATDPVDLILLDLQMPVLNGFSVLDRLAHAGRTVPVVVMTGYGDQHNLLRLMQRGCHNLLNKPFRPDEVLDMVHKVLERPLRPVATPSTLTSLGGCAGPCPAAARRRLCSSPGRVLLQTKATSDGCILFIVEVAAHDGDMAGHLALIRESIASYAATGGDPAACLLAINRHLLARRMVPNLVTAQILVVSLSLGLIHVASAGQPLPLLLRRDGTFRWLGQEGDPLGVMPAISCTTAMADARAGDRVLLMNGGLLACPQPGGADGHQACVGPDTLLHLARRHQDLEPDAATDALLTTILGSCPQPDEDLLVAVVDIPGPQGDPP